MTKTRIRGVYKHQSGGYIARLRVKGISTSKTFTSLASAERWMNQAKGGLETGDVVVYEGALLSKEEAKARARANTNHTVTSLIERFRASGECRIKPAHLTAIGEGLGTEFVEDLSRATCLEFLEKHAQSAAPATFNRWRAGLHRLMSYAIEVDWRQDNPVTGIKRKSEKGNRRDRVLEVDEERALQAACDERSEALGLIFALCMATGARVGEITSLLWKHIDLKRGTIRLGEGTTKNSEPRTLVVRGRALDRLKQYAKVQPLNRQELVFSSSSEGIFDATKEFKKAASNIGETATLHVCRHTWATRLSRVPGMTMTQLRDAGGWKSLAMVARYSHEMTDDLASKLEEMLEAHE